MLIVKVMAKGVEPTFYELLKIGSVLFDPRPGWLLLGRTPGSRKQDVFWLHPDEASVEWVREFNF